MSEVIEGLSSAHAACLYLYNKACEEGWGWKVFRDSDNKVRFSPENRENLSQADLDFIRHHRDLMLNTILMHEAMRQLDHGLTRCVTCPDEGVKGADGHPLEGTYRRLDGKWLCDIHRPDAYEEEVL